MSQMALQSSKDLDARFASLSSTLQMKTHPPPTSLADSLPLDPRDILRAIAHADISRPPRVRPVTQHIEPVDQIRQLGDEQVTPFPPTPRTPRKGALR